MRGESLAGAVETWAGSVVEAARLRDEYEPMSRAPVRTHNVD